MSDREVVVLGLGYKKVFVCEKENTSNVRNILAEFTAGRDQRLAG